MRRSNPIGDGTVPAGLDDVGALLVSRPVQGLEDPARPETFDASAVSNRLHGMGVSVDQVAGMVAGISAIGKARKALESAGLCATIAGNRITVNDEVLAELICAGAGPPGAGAKWVVYHVASMSPVCVVGAEDPSAGSVASPRRPQI